jgi:hypothetical protein
VGPCVVRTVCCYMEFLILAIVVVVLAALYVLGHYLVRRLTARHVAEGHNDVLVPLFLTAGTLYAVLLAFLVIAVWETYTAAKDNVAEEASTLATMYRQTAGMPTDEQRKMRAVLREYAEAVIKDEWSIQAQTGGASPKARHSVAGLYRTFGALKLAEATSPISIEFLHTFSTVAADRNRRTLQANEQLPIILWLGLLVGAVIVVTMSFFLYMETPWPHVVMSGLMSLLIVTLLVMMLLLNQPFKGPLALSPDSFEHSLGVFDSVDKGN